MTARKLARNPYVLIAAVLLACRAAFAHVTVAGHLYPVPVLAVAAAAVVAAGGVVLLAWLLARSPYAARGVTA